MPGSGKHGLGVVDRVCSKTVVNGAGAETLNSKARLPQQLAGC